MTFLQSVTQATRPYIILYHFAYATVDFALNLFFRVACVSDWISNLILAQLFCIVREVLGSIFPAAWPAIFSNEKRELISRASAGNGAYMQAHTSIYFSNYFNMEFC